jgi:flavin reductase (DIM6/NTAB) family NADH-FMN oxidoreductase RutF
MACRTILIPYSFFNSVCSNPPMVGFASEGLKDTANNIIATGEFVVNLVSMDMAKAMNITSAPMPPEDDEFAIAGLEYARSETVKPFRVAGTPAALECRLVNIIELTDLDGKATHNRFIIGQVTGIYIDDIHLKGGLFDVAAAGIISRLGYRQYSKVVDVFEMIRPHEQDRTRP